MKAYYLAFFCFARFLQAARIEQRALAQTLADQEDEEANRVASEQNRHIQPVTSQKLRNLTSERTFPAGRKIMKGAGSRFLSRARSARWLSDKVKLSIPSCMHAMWSWGSDVVETPQNRRDLLNFAKAPFGRTTQKFTYIWLNAYSALRNPARWQELRSMNSMLHQANIKVDFLDGNAEWILDDMREDGLNHCRQFKAFQDETADTSERFDGLQMDVEPWALEAWNSTETSVDLQNQYMDFIRACKAIINQPLAVAISFWWYKAPCFEDMMESEDLFSYLAVMNYRKSCDWADSAIGKMLEHANGRQKFVFGVETDPDVVATESYGTRGSARGYEAVFRDNHFFKQKYCSQRAFAGVAVHYYEDFKSIPAGNVESVESCPRQ